MNKSKNVLVVGAGVSGLSVAAELLAAGHRVTLYAREPEGELPSGSANAYAMWVPVKVDSDPRIEEWTDHTLHVLRKLAADPSYGICLRSIFQLKTDTATPWFAEKLKGEFRQARADEISCQYAGAHVLENSPVVDPPVYLKRLRQEILSRGGLFRSCELASLEDSPQEFELVVNCSSLGARTLASDASLFPQRMQVLKVRANGFPHVVIDDEGPNKRACVVPHRDYIKLGAVFDLDGESLEVDEKLSSDIIARCNKMVPGLNVQPSDVLSVHRALRPERPLPRVENSALADGRTLIHNYGHDGMGYILSAGIAASIANWVAAD